MHTPPPRPGTSRVLPIALIVVLAAVTIQVALAGAAAFGAPGWDAHEMLGVLIAVLAVITFVVALVARPGRDLLAVAGAILVLAGIQPLFAGLAQGSDPWFGLLHAADALALFALSAWGARVSLTDRLPIGRTSSGAS